MKGGAKIIILVILPSPGTSAEIISSTRDSNKLDNSDRKRDTDSVEWSVRDLYCPPSHCFSWSSPFVYRVA